MRWKGLLNISEDFMSCTYLEFTSIAMFSYLNKQTTKKQQQKTTTKNNNKKQQQKTGKNITEKHKHSLKREVGLFRRLSISP